MMLDLAIIVTVSGAQHSERRVPTDRSTKAIPRITSDFHSLSDVGWYGSAYMLASCSLQPLTGKIYAHFGTKVSYDYKGVGD